MVIQNGRLVSMIAAGAVVLVSCAGNVTDSLIGRWAGTCQDAGAATSGAGAEGNEIIEFRQNGDWTSRSVDIDTGGKFRIVEDRQVHLLDDEGKAVQTGDYAIVGDTLIMQLKTVDPDVFQVTLECTYDRAITP